MDTVKLKKPLFVNGNYNRTGIRMRCILDREISNGTDTYQLWRSAGKPEVEYPSTNNDRYLLYVEIGEFLAPLGLTDFRLTDICGYPEAMKNLYGSPEGREQFFCELRNNPNASSLVVAAVAKEQAEINRIGADPAAQADYVKRNLQDHIEIYEKAKKNNGASHPDFIGALALNELDECVALAQKYRERLEVIEREEMERRHAEDLKMYREMNKKADAALEYAVKTIQEGGVLRNTELTTYCEKTDSCQEICIINRLFEKYGIALPARTKGWIGSKLVSISFIDGKVANLQYQRINHARVSQVIWDYLRQLCLAVNEKKTQEV